MPSVSRKKIMQHTNQTVFDRTMKAKHLLFWKPYHVLSQFSPGVKKDQKTLQKWLQNTSFSSPEAFVEPVRMQWLSGATDFGRLGSPGAPRGL